MFIKFGSKLYRQIVDHSVFLWVIIVLLLLQICFYFVMRETPCLQEAVVVAFNSTSRYLDDLLNIDNPYFAKWLVRYTPLNFS